MLRKWQHDLCLASGSAIPRNPRGTRRRPFGAEQGTGAALGAERFLAEIRVTANLLANIVPVLTAGSYSAAHGYDVTPDGNRFLMVKVVDRPAPSHSL